MSHLVFDINPQAPETSLIKEVAALLRKGQVCAYPTETFYGLGVDMMATHAIKKLFDLKRRDYGNPVAVIVADRNMLASVVKEIPEKALRLMDVFWPGPLTILFPTNDRISKRLTTNTGKIGIRISSHPVASALVQELGRPLTTTSANLSGFPPSLSLKHLKSYFGDRIDVIVNSGELPPTEGSTVVDVTEEKVVIIREGVIRSDLIFQYCDEEDRPTAQGGVLS